MAKKKKLTKQDSIRDAFSFDGFEKEHFRRTETYAAAIDQLYNAAVADFARLASTVKVDPDKPFDFAKGPAFQAKAQEIVDRLAAGMSAVIRTGTEKEWLYANQKNDAFLKHIMDTSKIGKRTMNKLSDRNLNALDAFQKRKVGGLDLSQRVWQYAGQTKSLMEMGIDIAVGDGRPATQLSRDLRSYLREPEKLFRRVRDKHGNLVLSQRAAAYHPGQGVYRSSYMNAMRLARTEINMAYRDADRRRWAAMDFVVGFRVVLSNTHPVKDICDKLAGDYPKDFVFKGWHPQCKCHVVPILMDRDEFNTDELNELKAAIRGDKYEAMASRKTVTDIPSSMKDWIKENRERSLTWKKQPYFIKDNFEGGTLEGELHLTKPTIARPQPEPKKWDDLSQEEQAALRDRYFQISLSDEYSDLLVACQNYGIDCSFIDKFVDEWPSNSDKLSIFISEFNRLKAQCDATSSTMRQAAKVFSDQVDVVVGETAIWTGKPFGQTTEQYWNLTKGDRWPNWPSFNRAMTNMKDSAEKAIATGKAAFDAAIQKAKNAIATMAAGDPKKVKLEALIKETPTVARPAPSIVADIDALIVPGLLDAETLSFKQKAGMTDMEKWAEFKRTYIQTYGEKDPMVSWFKTQARFETTEAGCKALLRVCKKQMTADHKAVYGAVNHLAELKAVDPKTVAAMPKEWQTVFNDLMKKIRERKLADGYFAIYPEVEHAYNILKLSTMKEVKAIGFDKVSDKMPFNILTEYAKKFPSLAKDFPSKAFWDAQKRFTPLVSTGSGGYYKSYYRHVVIGLKDKDNIKRLTESEWYRKGLFHHEFGHAMDHQFGWKASAKIKTIFDEFKKEIAVLDPDGKNVATLMTEFIRETRRAGLGSADFDERIGSLSDCIQAATPGHAFVGTRGHDVKYFRSTDAQLAEFIAHASENFWSGNDLFKKFCPKTYELMRKFIKEELGQ